MAGLKNKLGLSIDSAPKTHKKYLGEPDDPHYAPDSPLIERQHFTEQEEGELKRICALALAQIPHSDDMTDDPFKFIISQVQHAPEPAPTKPTTIALSKTTQPKQAPPQRAPFIPDPVDTATPSESSKRDTFDISDYSTPLTSAGITPAETGKRFSDAARRASSSKASSNLKYDSSQKSKSRAASSSHGVPRKSAEAGIRKTHDRKPSKDNNNPTKQSVKLVQQTPRPSDGHTQSAEIVRPVRFSQLELNKKLPPLPRSETDPTGGASVSRFMKTIKKKKSQALEGRSVSTSAASSPVQPVVSQFNSTAKQPPSRAAPTRAAPPPPLTPPRDQKQGKFKFSRFFGARKESPATVMVS